MKMPRLGARLATLLLLAATASSCGNSPTDVEFDDSLDIDLAAMTKTGSGLYYLDLLPGDGTAAKAGDHVDVTYSGWLTNGQGFGSGAFDFVLGTSQAIQGFDEGVTGMKPGGKRKLVIPPELAYGNRGQGSIPPNATLVFEVQLVGVR